MLNLFCMCSLDGTKYSKEMCDINIHLHYIECEQIYHYKANHLLLFKEDFDEQGNIIHAAFPELIAALDKNDLLSAIVAVNKIDDSIVIH